MNDFLHEFDPSAINPDNLISGEVHSLADSTAQIIMPVNGLFYTKSLVVIRVSNQYHMRLGIDYAFQGFDSEITALTGYETCAAIAFLNPALTGNIEISYQCVGGKEGLLNAWVNDLRKRIALLNSQSVTWNQIINPPTEYPPAEHTHDLLTDLTNFAALRAALERIIVALADARVPVISGIALSDRIERLLGLLTIQRRDINNLSSRILTGTGGSTGSDNTKEDKSNKVTSITTNSTSNTKYPTVKAVYTWFSGIISNLTTASIPDSPNKRYVTDTELAAINTMHPVFKTIAVPGHTSIIAESSTDTLTLIPGSNVNIVTDEVNDSLTISFTSPTDTTKEDVANKSISVVTDITSDIKYPSVKAVYNWAIETFQLIIASGTASQYYRGDKTWATLDKAAVGLPNVDNTADIDKPVSTAQALADTAILDASKIYTEGLVIGLLDDRGGWDASGDVFPSTGGSGIAGAIKKGDLWFISASGTLGGGLTQIGSSIRALVDDPGQTAGNWNIINTTLGFTPENNVNKSTSIIADAASDVKYPSVKAVYDWALSVINAGIATSAAYADSLAATLSTSIPASILNSAISGFTAAADTISSADTLKQMLQKIVGNLSLKQESLVNQVTLKSINLISLLGAGNISITMPTPVSVGGVIGSSPLKTTLSSNDKFPVMDSSVGWAPLAASSTGAYNTAAISDDGKVIAVGMRANVVNSELDGGFFISVNYGATLTFLALGTKSVSASISRDGVNLLLVGHTTVYFSSDSYATYSSYAAPVSYFTDGCMSPDGNIWLVSIYNNNAGGNAGYLIKSTDKGLTWVPLSAMGRFNAINLKISNDGLTILFYDTSTNKIYKSTSGGSTIPTEILLPTGVSYMACSDDFQFIYLVTATNEFYRSINGGTSFILVETRPNTITAISLKCSSDGRLVTYKEDNVAMRNSLDYGVTFITESAYYGGGGNLYMPAIGMSSDGGTRIAGDGNYNVGLIHVNNSGLGLKQITYANLLAMLNVITPSSTNTLTNKRITNRVDSATSSATPTINTDSVDVYKLTAQSVDITSFTTNLSGTPTDSQFLEIIITGTVACSIAWGASFVASTIALPTTTVSTNTLRVTLQYDSVIAKWVCVGVV